MAPTNAESLLKAIDATVDPVKACDKLYECIQGLTSQLVGLLGQDGKYVVFILYMLKNMHNTSPTLYSILYVGSLTASKIIMQVSSF